MKWRVIDTGSSDAYMNMAIDEAIMVSVAKEYSPPTLRFYRWEPAGLSIGYAQNYYREVNEAKCRTYGVLPVRRLTGGRAVLHANELTYSVVVSLKESFLPVGVIDSYRFFSQGIVIGLKKLGIEAEMESKPTKKVGGGSSACFDAPSWYEIVVGGKKVVGSAQTRRAGVLMQHGSIPFKHDADLIYEILQVPNEETKRKLAEIFCKKAAGLYDICTNQVDYNALKNALIFGWQETLGISIEYGELTYHEKKLAVELAQKKYLTDEWNKERKEIFNYGVVLYSNPKIGDVDC